ncbi:MAG: acyl-CoA dehydratase activase-related protein [Fibromonadales bacterium]|nr:acyl-CoA dehydratase activase-related protein [Fibromonadales bacterium]
MLKSTFIGLDSIEKFGWEKRPGQICQFCSNNCSRTIVVFNDGRTHVTGNRCERGEVIASPDDSETKKAVAEINRKMNSVPDLVKRANQLLIKSYNSKVHFKLSAINSQPVKTIGIPRALEFFVSLPFWKAFFTSLGLEVIVSRQSDYNLFEEGLRSVPSDTICFPAKLMHGHVADLVKKKVDRIFLPSMLGIPSDHKKFKATAVCPVVQGTPPVVRNIDDPEGKHGIPVDQPTFHWYTEDLRRSQCIDWFSKNWKIPKKIVDAAVTEGEIALQIYIDTLQHEGQKILDNVRAKGEFAVVVAGRPYHLDPLVNHLVANHFTQMGIPVLPLEALPGVFDQEIPANTRMEALNSFHMRMLGATLLATKDPSIELVQIVSFGCGHDAILSDEMVRILHERSEKELLMLKLDEGDVRGPVSIRIKSFIETVKVRRSHAVNNKKTIMPLYSVPYTKEDKKKRIVLIPNLSPAFSLLCSKVMERQGFKTELLPLADKKAFELGKKYVHNDICFPAQVNIGEGLRWLEQHPDVDQSEVCMGLAKNCENCRAGQYAVMCRKALDEAGFPNVPILTTGTDNKNMHPGFSAGIDFRVHMLWGMTIMDCIEIMFRTVRPYEKNNGESLRVYNYWIKETMTEAAGNIRGAMKKLAQAVEAFNHIEANMSVRKPRVAVLGEILMKYHPSANGFVEEYLFEHGMEVVQPGMLDFFRVGELVRMEKVRRGLISHPFVNWLIGGVSAKLYSKASNDVEKLFKKFKFYEHHATCYEMAEIIEKTGMLDKTYITGEGWLIPGEILSLAEHGVNSFVIVQPFACLANHISGRGLTKAVKAEYPHIQVLSLDYDPDTSFANIENRLQMLIINAKELEKREK